VKLLIWAVGKPGKLLAPAIRDYERRAARYVSLDVIEIAGGREGDQDRDAEKLVARVPEGFDALALTRNGQRMSSKRLARYLEELGTYGRGGAAFLVGGPFGLGEAAFECAKYRLSLSAMSLPRDLARLVLAEQLYRAGTLIRGEPYHKGA
jgi:23S rRNA (pseudouridine1915-N3)-methyltransferase